MAETTGIAWTDATFNPWRGCTKVSAGCANCYADTMSKRNPGTLGVWGPNGTRVVAAESYWREPVKWNAAAEKAGERRRVFCASLADVFEDWDGHVYQTTGRPLYISKTGGWLIDAIGPSQHSKLARLDDVRRRLFALIDATPNLDWLLLTKRPENICKYWYPIITPEGVNDHVTLLRPNVWLGTSVEDQANADKRIPKLLECRNLAPVLFLSAEPLLGPIDLTNVGTYDDRPLCSLSRHPCVDPQPQRHEPNSIDWVIVGGESGHGARPCNLAWIRSLRDQCKAAGVACFIKQLGSQPLITFEPGQRATVEGVLSKLTDRKGGNIEEWPEDLRVREFPSTEPAHA